MEKFPADALPMSAAEEEPIEDAVQHHTSHLAVDLARRHTTDK
jgi:hypothetical protein